MAEENDSQQEPSMEDILASIRRILSEDEQEQSVAVDQPEASADIEPAVETEFASKPDMEVDTAAAMEEEPVASDPEPETVLKETESALVPEIEAEHEIEPATETPATSSSSDPPSIGDPVFEDILELTEQMIAPPPPEVGAGDSILSGTAQVSSTDTLQELAKALLSRRDIAIGSREITLEGLVREILRPLLREWLDENLPYLIERLVKKEIDHMVNRAERLDL